jgi:DNA-directed RNA polymerase sigma subunit (sigma70/sigma32)
MNAEEPREGGHENEQERLDEEERREAARRVRELPLTEAQRALVLSALRRVQKTAKTLGLRWSSMLTMRELLSAGHLGVVLVTQTYNPSIGPFGPYAANRVLER